MPVTVSGTINRDKINIEIHDSGVQPFHLGPGLNGQEIIAIIGSDETPKRLGMGFSIIGPAWIEIANALTEDVSGLLKEGQTLKVTNPLNRQNSIEAIYSKGNVES